MKKFIIILVSLLFSPIFSFASTTNGTILTPYAWGENVGWVNFTPTNGNVHITDSIITGYAWDSVYGWINLSPDNAGVKNDGLGNLSGFAWSQNAGWVNFDGIKINSGGKFNGIATGTIYGKLSFDCDNCNVTTDWRTPSGRGPNNLASSPTAGIYNSVQFVTLSANGSTSIRFSTTSTPTNCSSGTLYTMPIQASSPETIYVRACDDAGNSITSSFNYNIDTIPPSTPVSTPLAGIYNTTQSVSINATGSDYVKYSTVSSPSDCSSGTLYTSSSPISVSSSETIYTRACDLAGNSSTANFSYIIDSVPPEAPTASSPDGLYNSALSITLNANGSSYIKYGTDSIPATCSDGLSYIGPIPVASSKSIYVRACDDAGNSSTVTFTYDIDTSIPLNPILTPSSGIYNSIQSVSLSASGSSFIKYSTVETPSSCSTGTLYVSPIMVSATETIYVRACTNAGNSSVASFLYTIDTVPPETPISSPSSGIYNSTQLVTLNSAGSDYIKYSTSSLPETCLDGSSYNGPITVPITSSVYVRACDDAGNSSTTNFTYTIDEATPIISSISSNSTPTISWITNKPASSSIDYGLTNSYGTSTGQNDTNPRVENHEVTLPNLSSCTTYHYRIHSVDAALNESTSPDQTFTTNNCTASSIQTSFASIQFDKQIGGTLSTQDNELTLNVPAFFGDKNAVFQIHKLDRATVMSVTSIPAGYLTSGGNIYELKSLSDNTTVISAFTAPLNVQMKYSSNIISGLDESTLKIYRWDNSTWNQLSNCSVDTSAKIVSCTTNNFSVFGLFGQAQKKSNSTSGCSVLCQVTNLLSMGKKEQADVLIKKYPKQFPIRQIMVTTVVPTGFYTFTKTLKLKMTSPDVKELQKFLNSKGYFITKKGAGSIGHETSYFGPATKAALMKIQKANKLKADGILGPKTRALIIALK